MPHRQIAGMTIDTDAEGYMTNHAQWNRDLASAFANEVGIELTPGHWKVLEFVDKDFKEKGVVPGMRRMNKVGGIPTKDLYGLFPDRSEEHTSELQSRGHLVCRLLLEKKKKTK